MILFSLVLNAVDKIKAYMESEKSVWQEGDSVRVRKGSFDESVNELNFMVRLF
ncbi:MAG: hypothetical protein Q4B58_03665 [Bacteroidales bacterium]|nr:hypothetical protein [Bacteroidales bacterium]